VVLSVLSVVQEGVAMTVTMRVKVRFEVEMRHWDDGIVEQITHETTQEVTDEEDESGADDSMVWSFGNTLADPVLAIVRQLGKDRRPDVVARRVRKLVDGIVQQLDEDEAFPEKVAETLDCLKWPWQSASE
jgi:hypothetical protein